MDSKRSARSFQPPLATTNSYDALDSTSENHASTGVAKDSKMITQSSRISRSLIL